MTTELSPEILNDVELDSDAQEEIINESPKTGSPQRLSQQIDEKDSSETIENDRNDTNNTTSSIKTTTTTTTNKNEEKKKDDSWYGTLWRFGENVLYVADFLGEVFAEFFGMNQSRYQWAIDAYQRQKRWEREEKKKEEYYKKLYMKQRKKKQKNKNNDIQYYDDDDDDDDNDNDNDNDELNEQKLCEEHDDNYNHDNDDNLSELNQNEIKLSISPKKQGVINNEELRMNWVSTQIINQECEIPQKEEQQIEKEIDTICGLC